MFLILFFAILSGTSAYRHPVDKYTADEIIRNRDFEYSRVVVEYQNEYAERIYLPGYEQKDVHVFTQPGLMTVKALEDTYTWPLPPYVTMYGNVSYADDLLEVKFLTAKNEGDLEEINSNVYILDIPIRGYETKDILVQRYGNYIKVQAEREAYGISEVTIRKKVLPSSVSTYFAYWYQNDKLTIHLATITWHYD